MSSWLRAGGRASGACRHEWQGGVPVDTSLQRVDDAWRAHRSGEQGIEETGAIIDLLGGEIGGVECEVVARVRPGGGKPGLTRVSGES